MPPFLGHWATDWRLAVTCASEFPSCPPDVLVRGVAGFHFLSWRRDNADFELFPPSTDHAPEAVGTADG